MIVPILERPDAEDAPAAGVVSLTDWTDGDDPYAATAALLDPDGRYAISDSAWAMHVLGLQTALPGSSYVSVTSALPMLRAVKNEDEIERLATAGAAADASFENIAASTSRAAPRARSPPTSPACCASTDTRRWTSPSSARGPTAPTRTTR